MSSTIEQSDESYASGLSEPYAPYRRVSWMAVASVVCCLFSLFAYLEAFIAVLVPGLALLFGILALRAIRRHPDELVGRRLAQVGVGLSSLVWVTSLGLHIWARQTELPPGYTRVDWSDLQPDPTVRGNFLQTLADDLGGRKVFIKGYVYPNTKRDGLKRFVLVRDRGTCCFGGQPKATDMVLVSLQGDLRINYSWRLRKLGGTFMVQSGQETIGKITSGPYRLVADYLK